MSIPRIFRSCFIPILKIALPVFESICCTEVYITFPSAEMAFVFAAAYDTSSRVYTISHHTSVSSRRRKHSNQSPPLTQGTSNTHERMLIKNSRPAFPLRVKGKREKRLLKHLVSSHHPLLSPIYWLCGEHTRRQTRGCSACFPPSNPNTLCSLDNDMSTVSAIRNLSLTSHWRCGKE